MVFVTFSIDFMIYWDTPVKYMNHKFQVLTDIYVCTGYFIGFTLLENVASLVKTAGLSGSFEFIKVSIIGTFWKIDSLKIHLSENSEKRLRKTSIFRRVAGSKKFFKRFSAF